VKKLLLSLLSVASIGIAATPALAELDFNDTNFLDSVKLSARDNSDYDTVRDFVNLYPEFVIKQAKTYCDGRQSGLNDDQITDLEAKAIGKSDGSMKAKGLLITVVSFADVAAPKYYCPGFKYYSERNK